jgi:hypothetical protein
LFSHTGNILILYSSVVGEGQGVIQNKGLILIYVGVQQILYCAGVLEQSMEARLGTEYEEGFRTGPPVYSTYYIGWSLAESITGLLKCLKIFSYLHGGEGVGRVESASAIFA